MGVLHRFNYSFAIFLASPRLAAVTAGAVSALALPPFGLWLLLFFTLPLLFLLSVHAPSAKSAFWRGWLWGFGFFVAGLYWIASALFVDIASFWWVLPLSVAALPAYLALYHGLLSAALFVLAQRGWKQTQLLLLMPLLWVASEILRGNLFTGFPWNPLGSVFIDAPWLLQGASLFGVLGLSALAVLLGVLPLLWQQSRPLVLALLLPVLLLCFYGAQRLTHSTQFVPEVRLRLVQPNIPQTLKINASAREQIWQQHLRLTMAPAEKPPTHIIWPEAAVPFLLSENPLRRIQLAPLVPIGGALLLGNIRREIKQNQEVFYNSLIALDDRGDIVATYDKHHLVPFGEYFPLRRYLMRWLPVNAVAAADADFSAGAGVASIAVPGLHSVAPSICYEAIFSSYAMPPNPPPSLLLNVTNDGWFGQSTGPYQHAFAARLRAIETGLPMVRVANTGVSFVADGLGRIVAIAPLGAAQVLDAPLPKALPATFYSQYPHLPLLVFLLCLGGILFAVRHSSMDERLTNV